MEELAGEVKHADIEYLSKVLPDRVRDSSKERRTVNIACNVHKYFPAYVIKYGMCDVQDILGNVVGEISQHQANVLQSICKVDSAI